MDLNPLKPRFNFNFQVWRPSPTVNETECYSLVGNHIVTSISIPAIPESERVARATPSPQDQLQFQPGDVLGFYVESNGSGSGPKGDADNGVVLLNNGKHTSELVWFAKIASTTSQTSQSGSCPYTVGTTGVLNTSTHAAPVISIAVMTTPCLPSSLPHSTRTTFTSSMITAKVPGLKSVTISSSLITGVVVAICIMVVCISAIIIIFAVIVKRYSMEKEVDDTGMALSNQIYCESISIIVLV